MKTAVGLRLYEIARLSDIFYRHNTNQINCLVPYDDKLKLLLEEYRNCVIEMDFTMSPGYSKQVLGHIVLFS